MRTRRHIGFLLALLPVSGFLFGNSAGLADVKTGTHSRLPVLHPPAIPQEVSYANCDGSTTFPIVNILDIVCFLDRVAVGHPYANCDGSTERPVITANDLQCFLNAYSIATEWQSRIGASQVNQ